jgi:predicted ABC-type ATPase
MSILLGEEGTRILSDVAQPPRLVVLAGPNGAGKSTCAAEILRGPLAVEEFVNADVIARGLSAFHPDRVAMAAGRVMLARLRELAAARASFAFETTLASRSFAPWIRELVDQGYEFHLVFFWLPSAEVAMQRVAERVRGGGHSVPEPTIRRRFTAGLQNFSGLYCPLAATWQLMDNTGTSPNLVANGTADTIEAISNPQIWQLAKQAIGL